MFSLKKWWRVFSYNKGILFLACIIGLSVSTIVRSLNAPADTVARPSDVEKAKRREVPPTSPDAAVSSASSAHDPDFVGISANGVIEPLSDEIALALEVPGVIAAFSIKEGQSVKKGDILVTFKSQLESAQEKAAEAELKAARARAELARKSQERTQRLNRDKAATQEELDRAENTFALEMAQVLAAEARLEQAKAVRERLTLKAPIDGEILKINYRSGEYYSPLGGEPLLVMGDMQHLRVRIELDERDLAQVEVGSKGYFVADAFGEEKFTFTLTEIGRRMGRKVLKSDDPRERQDTRVLDIYGRVEGPLRKGLIPGLRVTTFMASQASGTTSH